MPRHNVLALLIIVFVLTFAGCSGPREAVANVPYHREAEVDLAKKYRTIGTRVVGADVALIEGIERDAMLPGLTYAEFEQADIRVEIVSGSLTSQLVLTDTGPVYKSGGEVSGYVHWIDVLFSQKGMIRVSDREGNELFRDNVDYSSTVNWGFSVRGPGKNIPQSGDSRFSRLGATQNYYSRGEVSESLRQNMPAVVAHMRGEVRRQFGWGLEKFIKQYTSGRDRTFVYLYTNGESGFLTPTYNALESGERVALERERAALGAIVASGYVDPADPEKKKILKPAQQAALHVNLGTLLTALGDRKAAEGEFSRARAFDAKIAAAIDRNKKSLALLTPPEEERAR